MMNVCLYCTYLVKPWTLGHTIPHIESFWDLTLCFFQFSMTVWHNLLEYDTVQCIVYTVDRVPITDRSTEACDKCIQSNSDWRVNCMNTDLFENISIKVQIGSERHEISQTTTCRNVTTSYVAREARRD